MNLGPKGAEHSKGVEYNAPSAPYQKLKDAKADGAWQNSQNGNSISYFSMCNDPADPSIESVARELLSDLRDAKVLRQMSLTYNAREALETEIEGKVDGVLTRIRTLIFKKNGCTYTLSQIGIPRAFEDDRSRFNEFLKGFRAP